MTNTQKQMPSNSKKIPEVGQGDHHVAHTLTIIRPHKPNFISHDLLCAVLMILVDNALATETRDQKSATAGFTYYGGNSSLYGTDSIAFGGYFRG